MTNKPRSASIRAITYCELFRLTRKDLLSVLDLSTNLRERLLELAQERLQKKRMSTLAASIIDTPFSENSRTANILKRQSLREVRACWRGLSACIYVYPAADRYHRLGARALRRRQNKKSSYIQHRSELRCFVRSLLSLSLYCRRRLPRRGRQRRA